MIQDQAFHSITYVILYIAIPSKGQPLCAT